MQFAFFYPKDVQKIFLGLSILKKNLGIAEIAGGGGEGGHGGGGGSCSLHHYDAMHLKIDM